MIYKFSKQRAAEENSSHLPGKERLSVDPASDLPVAASWLHSFLLLQGQQFRRNPPSLFTPGGTGRPTSGWSRAFGMARSRPPAAAPWLGVQPGLGPWAAVPMCDEAACSASQLVVDGPGEARWKRAASQ